MKPYQIISSIWKKQTCCIGQKDITLKVKILFREHVNIMQTTWLFITIYIMDMAME